MQLLPPAAQPAESWQVFPDEVEQQQRLPVQSLALVHD
jgi:hypothetical protein